MGFLRRAACWLGLLDQGWVRVRGTEVEVVITGDARRVRHLAWLVQEELVRAARLDAREEALRAREPGSAVIPVEIDERDAPYVVGGRLIRPAPRPSPAVAPGSGRRPGFVAPTRPARATRRASTRGGADADTELGLSGLLEVTEQ